LRRCAARACPKAQAGQTRFARSVGSTPWTARRQSDIPNRVSFGFNWSPIDSRFSCGVVGTTRPLLETEHVLQDKLRGGKMIGQLIDVDKVSGSTFDYQTRALKKDE